MRHDDGNDDDIHTENQIIKCLKVIVIRGFLNVNIDNRFQTW